LSYTRLFIRFRRPGLANAHAAAGTGPKAPRFLAIAQRWWRGYPSFELIGCSSVFARVYNLLHSLTNVIQAVRRYPLTFASIRCQKADQWMGHIGPNRFDGRKHALPPLNRQNPDGSVDGTRF
jgi:hypothetical protein